MSTLPSASDGSQIVGSDDHTEPEANDVFAMTPATNNVPNDISGLDEASQNATTDTKPLG